MVGRVMMEEHSPSLGDSFSHTGGRSVSEGAECQGTDNPVQGG